MDKMIGASCWLLLVLSAQRHSSAPMPAEGVRSSGVEVPDTETVFSPAVTSEEEALNNTGIVKDVRINSLVSGDVDSGSDVHIPVKLEIDEVDQVGQVVGETAQKDVVPVDSAGEALNPGDEEAVFIRLSHINKTLKEETDVSKALEQVDAASGLSLVGREEQETKEGKTGKHAEEEALDLMMLEGPNTGEETSWWDRDRGRPCFCRIRDRRKHDAGQVRSIRPRSCGSCGAGNRRFPPSSCFYRGWRRR
ncbi:uncharacterized protein [Nothobranchius furzeri]|uniref:uncharacterized protein n=1 Tax=Nothobranchius furzeri TaxID=105023 RepID=UPI0039048B67